MPDIHLGKVGSYKGAGENRLPVSNVSTICSAYTKKKPPATCMPKTKIEMHLQ